jgi:hypothetical protein
MQPTETFEQIEERMVDSDSDDEAIDDGACSNLELSPELANFVKRGVRKTAPLYVQPRLDMQVVLWTPKEDFVADIVNRSMKDRIVEIEDDSIDDDNPTRSIDDDLIDDDNPTRSVGDGISRNGDHGPYVSYPDSDDSDDRMQTSKGSSSQSSETGNLKIVELPSCEDDGSQMDIDDSDTVDDDALSM